MNIDNLDRLLGEGSYHWVYSLKENAHVAVKIAKQSHGQLKREAKVLNALEHSHLFPKVINILLQISESGTIHLSSPGETQ
jgi:predicted Ser/Thr protein kinase